MCTIYDFLGDHSIIYDNLCIQAMSEYEQTYNDFYQSRLLSNKSNPDSFYFALPTESLINSFKETKKILTQDNHISLEPGSNHNFCRLDSISTQAKIEKKT